MKNRVFILKFSGVLIMYSLFSVFVSSCSDFIEIEQPNVAKYAVRNANFAKEKLFSMGFDTLDIKELGEYYLVENDILINKNSINSHPMTRQYMSNYVVSAGTTITVSVDNTISETSGWIEALKEVCSIYHEYADLDFVYVNSNSDIIISKSYIGNQYICAMGNFPSSSGNPGKYVYVNTGFYKDIDSYLSHNQKVFLLMHEIGHNLGLRHTDCKVNNEIIGPGMNQIPGTPESDKNSFMNSSTCGKSWVGMQYYDEMTLAYLWPFSYTIHFENADIEDIVVKQKRKYYVSRYLIPQRKGYVFSGWQYSSHFYTPYCYNFAFSSDRTLYAAWRKNTNLETKTIYSGEGKHELEFSLDYAIPVTFTSTVSRALNTWYELRNAEGTFSKIEKIDGNCTFSKVIDMRNDEMWTSDDNNMVSHSETFMLEAGNYRLTSSMTTKLGDQNNTASGKHGSVNTTLTYYK